VKRHDYLVNLVQNVVESLLFYHPAVWWISRRVRFEREQVADDFAARTLGEPRRLALALSELERMQFADARSGQRLAQAANGGDLVARIRRLLKPGTQALNWQAAIPVLGLALACAAHTNVGTQVSTQLSTHVSAPHAAALSAQATAGETRNAGVDFTTCERPHYPHADLDAGHQGTVTLAFLVDRQGVVRDARVRKSSGYAGLDEAARGAIALCSFKPAVVRGTPVEKWSFVQYVWTLQ
jgi:D-alanyl-D-alanine endopeptidase (penicillin-binding protein 7)